MWICFKNRHLYYNLLKSTGLLSVRKSVSVCPFDVYVIRVLPFEEGLLTDKVEAHVITDSTEQEEYTTNWSLDVFDVAVDVVDVDVSDIEVVHVSLLLLLFVLSLSISLLLTSSFRPSFDSRSDDGIRFSLSSESDGSCSFTIISVVSPSAPMIKRMHFFFLLKI